MFGFSPLYMTIQENIPLAYSLVAQLVKNLPAMQETWARFLGQEDPLEKEMATYSSILAWKIPWTEEPGRLQSMGSQERLIQHHHFTITVSDNDLTLSSLAP